MVGRPKLADPVSLAKLMYAERKFQNVYSQQKLKFDYRGFKTGYYAWSFYLIGNLLKRGSGLIASGCFL